MNQYICKYHGLHVVHVECEFGLKRTLHFTAYNVVRCLLHPLHFALTLKSVGTEESRDSTRCVVTRPSFVGVGTVQFGFTQLCKASAPQATKYLHNLERQ